MSYTATDPIGSPRVLTDESGNIVSRRDFMPFGEEIQADATYRTAALKNGVGDNVRQKFTGYERDDESDLDFAQARYFSAPTGRFSSPDNFVNDTHQSVPQSWNLYTYARNNPLRFIDPAGTKAKITTRHDKETNTTTITISASFAVYAAEGQDVSREELNRQAQLLVAGIADAYNGQQFTIDGI